MYDELIKGLRICESGDKCDFCPKWLDKQNGGLNACTSALSKDAADAIEELQKQRDEWESHAALAESFAQGWISVAERLPEDRNIVLATVDRVVRIAFYGNYTWEEVETYSIFYPTHWMPLPEPPKEDE